MANMSLGQSDREMLQTYLLALLQRRKQLAPLRMSVEQIERVYVPGYFYATVAKLNERDPNNRFFLNAADNVPVAYKNFYGAGKDLHVYLRAKRVTMMAYNNRIDSSAPVLENSPFIRPFREWCVQAVKVQTTNQIVYYVARDIITSATTYKQLFKALPETMEAVSAHCSLPFVDGQWVYRNQRVKLRECLKINKQEGAKRARALPASTLDLLNSRRTLVEGTLASAVLLPHHDGIGEDLTFDRTWVDTVDLPTEAIKGCTLTHK